MAEEIMVGEVRHKYFPFIDSLSSNVLGYPGGGGCGGGCNGGGGGGSAHASASAHADASASS